jgi:hypothetical protein
MNKDKFDGLGINNNKADYEETPLDRAAEQIARASATMKDLKIATGGARAGASALHKSANKAHGLSAKGKTLNPNYLGDKNRMRPSVILGRVIVGGKVLHSGERVRGQESKPHQMHGTLNRAIRVNVPTKDGAGFTQKFEKVKIALKKGLIKTA